MLVSGSYFDVLGLKPGLGRLIGPGDDRAVGESPVVVLSHSYWRTRFDANPAVLNETMIINGQTMTVIGVAPQGFEGTTVGSRPQIYVPITMRALMQPRLSRLRTPQSLLGLPVRASETRRFNRSGADFFERAVSRDHQRCRSGAATGHERTDTDTIPSEAGSACRRPSRPEQHPGRRDGSFAHTSRCDRFRAADRLLEHRESSPGPRSRTYR